MTEQAKLLDDKAVDVFGKAGVEVVSMSAEDAAAWRAIAQETSYKIFAEKVPGGQELIEKALAVESRQPAAVEGRRCRKSPAPLCSLSDPWSRRPGPSSSRGCLGDRKSTRLNSSP